MTETTEAPVRRRPTLLLAFAAVHTVVLIGVLAALLLIYRSVGEIHHVNLEQLAPSIAQGPWPWVKDGSTLQAVTLEPLGQTETIPVGERRPILHGEWMNLSRYSDAFEKVTENGQETLVRKNVWIHIPSRTKVTLTYGNPRQGAASGQ